jgi:predicted nucleotide-binding protein (sugar kinase/HSP70/actin superfamily)
MKKDFTILIPMMAPIQFSIMRCILVNHGYHVELLENNGPGVVEEGLKYVHNDTCYPALLVIGQMLDALKSGLYDPEKTALMITQTGGGCRASNYIFLLRRALKKAGYEHIPVISFNIAGMEKNSGFQLTAPMLYQMLAGVVYGDGLMALSNQVKPYETEKGQADLLVNRWISRLARQFDRKRGYTLLEMKSNFRRIAADFDAIDCIRTPKLKVGIVGEIYVKYTSLGNNNLEAFLADEDCEVMVPGLLDFLLYTIDAKVEDNRIYGGGDMKAVIFKTACEYIQHMQNIMVNAIAAYPEFTAPSKFSHTKSMVGDVIGTGCTMGEGWLLTAEMLELVEKGYGNIVCTQPFGCLPNHICGKGMIRKIRETNPKANIVPIDYDPSATKVNQENRIKLMLAVARENMVRDQETNGKNDSSDVSAPGHLEKSDPYQKWRRWLPHTPSHA